MAKRTIYISEDDTVADIVRRCPLAIQVLERHFGSDFLKQDDLEKISLKSAATLFCEQMHSILIELNRTCI